MGKNQEISLPRFYNFIQGTGNQIPILQHGLSVQLWSKRIKSGELLISIQFLL